MYEVRKPCAFTPAVEMREKKKLHKQEVHWQKIQTMFCVSQFHSSWVENTAQIFYFRLCLSPSKYPFCPSSGSSLNPLLFIIESGKNISTPREPRMNRDQLELAQKRKQPGPCSHTLLLSPADVPVMPPRHWHLGSTKWTGVVFNKIPSGHRAVGLQPQNMITMQQWLFRLPCPESTWHTSRSHQKTEHLSPTQVRKEVLSQPRENPLHKHPSSATTQKFNLEIQTLWFHTET